MLRAFLLGSLLYPGVELCYRRRTHFAMALAGGTALCALLGLHRSGGRRSLWQNALLGGAVITGIEFVFGLLFNRHYRIWDYRRTPYNVQGQICLSFSLAWCALSAMVLGGMRLCERGRARL
ncbi:MAG: hypothetical protein RR367_03935 [Clostridia bacterium]